MFLYSLWDSPEFRASARLPEDPDYEGDNEDLSLSGSTIGLLTDLRYNYSDPITIKSFYDCAVNLANPKYWVSITALYNSAILKSSVPRSVTPTELGISVENDDVSLSWEDNTCPSLFFSKAERALCANNTETKSERQLEGGWRTLRWEI